MNVYDDAEASTWQREFVFGLLGFSAGQFFGIHDRRMPVTIFLDVPDRRADRGRLVRGRSSAGTPGVALRRRPDPLPGGDSASSVRSTGPPARLDGCGHWIRCGLVVLVGFAWTGFVLWHRTAEVPDVGEPFVATDSPTESPLERMRNNRIAAIASGAESRIRAFPVRAATKHAGRRR